MLWCIALVENQLTPIVKKLSLMQSLVLTGLSWIFCQMHKKKIDSKVCGILSRCTCSKHLSNQREPGSYQLQTDLSEAVRELFCLYQELYISIELFKPQKVYFFIWAENIWKCCLSQFYYFLLILTVPHYSFLTFFFFFLVLKQVLLQKLRWVI